jgi:hypothetical protein
MSRCSFTLRSLAFDEALGWNGKTSMLGALTLDRALGYSSESVMLGVLAFDQVSNWSSEILGLWVRLRCSCGDIASVKSNIGWSRWKWLLLLLLVQ